MKKLLMSLALVGTFAAMSAKGESYMYWMVTDAKEGGQSLMFNSAELYVVQNNAKVAYLGAVGADADPYSSSSTRGIAGNYYGDCDNVGAFTGSYDITGYANTAYSFMVELYKDDLWVSQSTLTYEEVLAKGGFYKSLMPSGAGAAFTTFSVPEPTSGLLMLFGLCGLALKRKRA